MLDKTSKKFMDFLDKLPGDEMQYGSVEIPNEFGDSETFFAMIRYLTKEGYLEPIESGLAHIGTRLSYKGIHRKEFRRSEVIRYLEEKWIDFFSLVVACGALVISIAALLSKVPG